MIRGSTGLMYDDRMTQHRCLWDPKYPECPERYACIIERCIELNLIERCTILNPRIAEIEEILKKHTQEHYDALKSTSNYTDEVKMEEYCSRYAAIYIHPTTFALSLLAAGSTIEMIDNILENKVQNAMAIIRPPGHHAMKSEICGFCYFNNVALAAQHALDNRGLKRILIVDWDIHHGQATQQMFYEDPRVIYFSIHRYERGLFWPWLRESDFDFIGDGNGRGFNINVPLNSKGMTNADYLAIFQQILMPVALEFQPELVIVSAGYDSALGDQEGLMEVTPACYSHLISLLSTLANGKIAAVLEGGYCFQSLAEGAALTLKTLLGDPCPKLIEPLQKPSPSVCETILNCIHSLRPYWQSLRVNATYDTFETSNEYFHQVVQSFEYKRPYPKVHETRAFYAENNICDISKDRLNKLILETSLEVPNNRVCYSINKLRFNCEGPIQVNIIEEALKEIGAIERMEEVSPRIAKIDEVCFTSTRPPSKAEDVDLTCRSAGTLLQIVENVMSGSSRSGVYVDQFCGEVLANSSYNVIVTAAQYSIEKYGVKRILIVDWNIQHDASIQNTFYRSSNVLYVSIHGKLPTLNNDGDITMTGDKNGTGFNVNIQWTESGMGNMEYAAVFNRIIMPIAYEFAPELIIVSAGFDTPSVTPNAYGYFINWLSCISGGRIIVCADVGFEKHPFACGIIECVRSLLGDPLSFLPLSDEMKYGCSETIDNVLSIQQKFWHSLQFNKKLPRN